MVSTSLHQIFEMLKGGGVLVVVLQWYGGTHLGPKRFAHIVNVARELFVECHDVVVVWSKEVVGKPMI